MNASTTTTTTTTTTTPTTPTTPYALYAAVVVMCACAASAYHSRRAPLGAHSGLFFVAGMAACVAWALRLGRPGLALLVALLAAAAVAVAFFVHAWIVAGSAFVHVLMGSTPPPQMPFWRWFTGF